MAAVGPVLLALTITLGWSDLDAHGGEHSFVWDARRNLVAKEDANGHLTAYGYDALDRRTDEWQHLGPQARLRTRVEVAALGAPGPADPAKEAGALHWRVTHDEHGNRLGRTDPRGYTTT